MTIKNPERYTTATPQVQYGADPEAPARAATCLLCGLDIAPEEHDACGRRTADGALVCPKCKYTLTHPHSPGYIDARDRWFDKKRCHA
ncbi:MAG TPA: hypothetical protein VFH61_04255 [Thermoleophilia bacterium]|nr:hypothetical protein [Thermoleophilia bacterium]